MKLYPSISPSGIHFNIFTLICFKISNTIHIFFFNNPKVFKFDLINFFFFFCRWERCWYQNKNTKYNKVSDLTLNSKEVKITKNLMSSNNPWNKTKKAIQKWGPCFCWVLYLCVPPTNRHKRPLFWFACAFLSFFLYFTSHHKL